MSDEMMKIKKEIQDLREKLYKLEWEKCLTSIEKNGLQGAKIAADYRKQIDLFNKKRSLIQSLYRGFWVGFQGGEMFVEKDHLNLSRKMHEAKPGCRGYVEKIR